MPTSQLHSIPYIRAARAAFTRLAGSRLFHFLVLGGAIFATQRAPSLDRRIDIDSRRVLAESARGGGPAAADAEAGETELLSREVEDELLLREAERLGLQRDDEIIRRRLIQKTLQLAEDLGGASRLPTEDELRSFFLAHAARYKLPEQVRFVFVSAATRERAESLREPLSQLAVGDGEPPALGDPVPVSRRMSATMDEVANSFGADFAAALAQLKIGTWSPPLKSRYGWQLVLVQERQLARPASFDDVRAMLPLDFLTNRRSEAIGQFVRQALRRYTVRVDGRVWTTLPPSQRTAMHGQDSAED
jgi:hypothetical protein